MKPDRAIVNRATLESNLLAIEIQDMESRIKIAKRKRLALGRAIKRHARMAK